MPADAGTGVIAHAIQLAVAPVFLFTGIAGVLAVVANRLARVIDRARSLEQAMIALIVGLACFLREVYLATHTTKLQPARFEE